MCRVSVPANCRCGPKRSTGPAGAWHSGELCCQATALGTHIELQRCEPLQGEWDEFRIEQVLANLLSNALRYGERKPVQVRVFEQDGLACVQVQDHGIGICAANQQRIFQQFERVATQRASGGLGLGSTYRNRSSVPTAGAYWSRVKRAKAPPSPCNCHWQPTNNKTTRHGQPLPEHGV